MSGGFLGQAVVLMADGSTKHIEDIMPGEMVRGRHGESNMVLALRRPLAGRRAFYIINGNHSLSEEQIHWSRRGPLAVNAEAAKNEKGKAYPVLLANGELFFRKNIGLKYVLPLLPSDLLIGIDGLKPVVSLESTSVEESQMLFDLVLGGSHTYFVDGYLVAGWANDEDFDYRTWQPRPDQVA